MFPPLPVSPCTTNNSSSLDSLRCTFPCFWEAICELGQQDKANGRSSLAYHRALHAVHSSTWWTNQYKVYIKGITKTDLLKCFFTFFFLSVKEWGVWKWKVQCFIYYFCYFSLSFILWYLNTSNKYHWLLDPFLSPSSYTTSCHWRYRVLVLAVIFVSSSMYAHIHGQHSNFPLFLSMYEHSRSKCPFPICVSMVVK